MSRYQLPPGYKRKLGPMPQRAQDIFVDEMRRFYQAHPEALPRRTDAEDLSEAS